MNVTIEENKPNWKDLDPGQFFLCTDGYVHMVVAGNRDAEKYLVFWSLGKPYLEDVEDVADCVEINRLLTFSELIFSE